ncbi:glycogen debranching protein GlgX [Roseiarcaceae bacterium H3SJ34-1]|uniref:glycogen debranching protein GlgX n=1 Tax=Terripilifer ovatus TaxID=3032367 RepID=UPI003AB988C6|nr:glycogen debranching protein GlgX [Roseiarcaceae bacterium H3SJ34-1]
MNHEASALWTGSHAQPGVTLNEDGGCVAVFSRHAETIWLCTFDPHNGRELERWRLNGRDGAIFHGFVPGLKAGACYGLRADGPYEPSRGHWFDPAKLLTDPYAKRLDRAYRFAPELSAPRAAAIDTAPLAPRAIIEERFDARAPFAGCAGRPRLIYEVAVKAFTKLHPGIPAHLRGTLKGLSHPACVEHLVRLGVSHVELMPIFAWLDERHLPPLGLANAWGYNPVVMMALDPRLAPAGLDDLRQVVRTLHEAGISVLLDVVFNHTAESDELGPTLSMRGLDNASYYRHDADGRLVNDTGCGNTLACDSEPVMGLVLDTMRYFVQHAGIDGFRFDLATIMGRSASGFSADAPLLRAIASDPVLGGVELIAEPWDIGPGGYQLGGFPAPFREWNDKYRDDVRRFWKCEFGAIGDFATRIAGSADVFESPRKAPSASVNFIAAHDGFTVRDLVSYDGKRNDANGEANRDGTEANFSWNNGADGDQVDETIRARRIRDVRALLATLLLSRGTPMLTAGDEFGRTQHGNNNAYAQDNETIWLDWATADAGLAEFTAALVHMRGSLVPLHADQFLTGKSEADGAPPDVEWWRADGRPMQAEDWTNGDVLALTLAATQDGEIERVFIAFNRSGERRMLTPPEPRPGLVWSLALDSANSFARLGKHYGFTGEADARGVIVLVETAG